MEHDQVRSRSLATLSSALTDHRAMAPLLEALVADTRFPVDSLWQREFITAAEFLNAASFHRRYSFDTDLRRADREPLGQVVCVLPGNGPLYTLAKVLAPALVTGNRVTFKLPSRLRRSFPLLRELLGDTVPEARLVFPDDPSVRARFVEDSLADPEVGALVLFGSASWAERLPQLARGSGAKLIFEGPGNDPAVVLPGADPAAAAVQILRGAFYNGGQSCSAIKRVYVHRQIREALLAALLHRVNDFIAGDSWTPGVSIGPCVGTALQARIRRQMQQARERRAVFHHGDGQLDGEGLFRPTIVEAGAHLQLVQEETFYPVVPLVTVADEAEAEDLIGSGRHGLNASVFGPCSARFLAFLWRTHKGVAVDSLITHPDNREQLQLVGGFRDSGFIGHWAAADGRPTTGSRPDDWQWARDHQYLFRHGRFYLERELSRAS